MGVSRALGLDIGTSAVRAVEITMTKAGPRIEKYVQIALPPGAVNSGDVVQPDVVLDALKRLRVAGKFRTNRVAFGIANQRVVVRQVDLPWMPADELRAALVFQVQDLLPMPVEDAVLDYHPIEEIVGEGGTRMLRAMLVAADAGMVERNLAVIRAAGLHTEVVDLTPFALLRAATLPSEETADNADNEAVVDVGASVTNIVIHSSGRPRFVRILGLGGESITESLAERLGIPRDDAEQRKCSVAWRGDALDAVMSEAPEARYVEAATSALVEEIRGSLDYYRDQPSARPLTRVVLSGGGALLDGLEQQLTAATHLPVQRAAGLQGILHGPQLTPEVLRDGGPFASTPLGLALRMAA